MSNVPRLRMKGRFIVPFAPPGPPVVADGPYSAALSIAATILTQVHCHTTLSDGSTTPAQTVSAYSAKGYGALMISDHDTVSAQPAGISIAITGNELSPTQQHIISMNSSYTRGSLTDAQNIINGIVAAGGVAEIAHPKWIRGVTSGELASLTDYSGFEIHNTHCINGAGQNPVTYPGYAMDRWDEVLTSTRRDIWGFSVDDRHADTTYDAIDVGRLKVFVETSNLAGVMASIASGNFVADVSNYGVTPGFPTRSSSDLSVTCSGATAIQAYGASGVLLSSSAGTSHTHDFDGTEQYVRLVAVGDYTEPFSSALDDRWIASGGTWSVAAGILSCADTTSSIGRQILRRHRAGDFTLQVDMRQNGSGGTGMGVIFNVLNASFQYLLRIGKTGSPTGYVNTLALAKTTTGSYGTPLATTPKTISSNVWYTLAMDYTASTGRIRAKVWARDTESDPGVWGIDHTDATWTNGAFGFRGNGALDYDNLYINGFQTFYQPVSVDPIPGGGGGGSSTFLTRPAHAPMTVSGGTTANISNVSIYDTGTLYQNIGITISGVHGTVSITDVDLADLVGGIFLINCSGTLVINNVRGRNIGDDTIGSGHSNYIQFNNCTFDGYVSDCNFLGGQTEDMISIYQSGGLSAGHELIIENNHLQGLVADQSSPTIRKWISNSGTGIIVGDGGGSKCHDTIVRNNTLLTPGQVGLQHIDGTAIHTYENVVFGEQRVDNNNPITSYAGNPIAEIDHNRYYWTNFDGSHPSPYYGAGTINAHDNVFDPSLSAADYVVNL